MKPSRVRAVRVKCFECMGFQADGRKDCEITTCPLYYWQPYKTKKPSFWWVKTALKDLGKAYLRPRGVRVADLLL